MTMMLPPPDLADRDAALTWLAVDATTLLRACASACHEIGDADLREALACVLDDLAKLVEAAAKRVRGEEPEDLALFDTGDVDWPDRNRALARVVEAGFGTD